MKIIIECPKGYPIHVANRVARLVEGVLRASPETRGVAIVGIDNTEDFAYAGPIWIIESRIEK
jgi:hypothetical protein